MSQSTEQLAQHLDRLHSHLQREQPLLADMVEQFRQLDQVAHSMGLIPQNQSFADRVSWWPLIAVLGTFSAGKSTFINDYLEFALQRTGHQAVDDKFSVIAYAAHGGSAVLPGTALDADPRFPFFSISKEIEREVHEEGRQIDSFLQLKTCPCEKLKGKIFVDSPGFDADDQRTATLRIADRIIERSDLVMVFFDAHRPEPGAIRDTLEHLVENVLERHDSTKFIYILNQIDITADDNDLEDVVAAWQRALAQKGLTAGRFYRIFSLTACAHIENEEARNRLLEWREQDMADIEARINHVELDRAYRVANTLRHLSEDIEQIYVPCIKDRLSTWRRIVLWGDGILSGVITLAIVLWLFSTGSWDGLSFTPPQWFNAIISNNFLSSLVVVFLVGVLLIFHFYFKGFALKFIKPGSEDPVRSGIDEKMLEGALIAGTRPLRSVFLAIPKGWHLINRRRLQKIRHKAAHLVQKLNDQYIDLTGKNENINSNEEVTATDENQNQEKLEIS